MVVAKKNLLVMAVTSAILFTASAQAKELTIYGTVGAAAEVLDNDTTSVSNVSNNHSALGLEGSIGPKGGTQAVFHYDMFIDIDDGGGNTGGSFFGGGRDGWVGVRNEAWGTIALGFQGRPWKTSTHHLDVFEGTIADYSAIMGNTGDAATYFDGGISSSIIWFGPTINGFSWHAQFGADEADTDANDWGIQGNYRSGPWYASLSFDEDGRASPASEVTAVKGAISYKFDMATLTGMYEKTDDSAVNSRNAFYLAGSYNISSQTRLKAAVSVADDLDNTSNTGATYWAVGVSHEILKDVEIYALYAAIDNDSAGGYEFVSALHTSTNSNTSITTPGDDSNVIAVGIKYNFSVGLIK